MPVLPTLILIAEPASIKRSAGGSGALGLFSQLASMVARIERSGLPYLLVCDEQDREAARAMVGDRHILAIHFQEDTEADQYVEALVAGIQAQVNASGWLALPLSLPMIEPETLRKVAEALQIFPIAYPEYHQQQGYPIGFSSELFSELMQLTSFRELERVSVRYPSSRVEVNDPGVLLIPQSLQRQPAYASASRVRISGIGHN